MAYKMLKPVDNAKWLSSAKDGEGVHVTANLHDERFLEMQAYNCDAPPEFRWVIHVHDLHDPARNVTLHCPDNYQKVTTQTALDQLRTPVAGLAAA